MRLGCCRYCRAGRRLCGNERRPRLLPPCPRLSPSPVFRPRSESGSRCRGRCPRSVSAVGVGVAGAGVAIGVNLRPFASGPRSRRQNRETPADGGGGIPSQALRSLAIQTSCQPQVGHYLPKIGTSRQAHIAKLESGHAGAKDEPSSVAVIADDSAQSRPRGPALTRSAKVHRGSVRVDDPRSDVVVTAPP